MRMLSSECEKIIQHHQQSWPVKVAAIARDLNVKMLASSLPNNISGSIRKEDGVWTVRVNRHESKERQRFTAAHEIAHYLLHQDKIGDGIDDNTLYRSTLSDKTEWEANRFAADLLMPWSLIRKAIDRGINTPEALAASFEVSEAAMKIRLGLPT